MNQPHTAHAADRRRIENAGEHAITLRGLTKTFGSFRALDGLDLTVDTGETHGFLGPNGAGKSTTIKILFGLLAKSGGHASVLGGDPRRDAVALHRRMAYVPGDVTLWPSLTGGECIDLLTRMRGAKIDRARRDELIERLDLDPRKRAKTYSKGNRQKVALVAAFATRSDLLVLDEPTSGLDPLMESVFQQLVKEAAAEGTTVLLSSHILAEVEALCDRLTIIRHGVAVSTDSLDEMRERTVSRVTATTREDVTGLGSIEGVHGDSLAGRHLDFSVGPSGLAESMACLTAAGLVSIVCQPPSLEELFLQHYEIDVSTPDAAVAR